MKIFHNGRQINGRFDSFKARLKRLFKFTIKWLFIGSTAYLIFLIGGLMYSTDTITTHAVANTTIPAVLKRIAHCESPTGHLDKNGQVSINSTHDIGKYQINVPIHGKKATELGYNLSIEKDNEAFALYLYENYGTEPWVHSKACWNK